MKILGITGYSGSGKTTLMTQLIARLVASGLDVAAIKHTHHDLAWDTLGRDSWRHPQAGAREVVLAAAERRMLVETLPAANDVALADHLARLAPCDLVLVEGYKHEAIPKLEVRDPALNAPRLYPNDPCVIALICDTPESGCLLPRYARDDLAGIEQLIRRDILV